MKLDLTRSRYSLDFLLTVFFSQEIPIWDVRRVQHINGRRGNSYWWYSLETMKDLIAFHECMVIPNNINLIIPNWGLKTFSPPKTTTRRTNFIWVHSTLLTIEEIVLHKICSVVAVFIWRLLGPQLVGRRHPFGTPLPARSYGSALTWLYSWLAGVPAAKRSRCVYSISISSFHAVQRTQMMSPTKHHFTFLPVLHSSVHSLRAFICGW